MQRTSHPHHSAALGIFHYFCKHWGLSLKNRNEHTMHKHTILILTLLALLFPAFLQAQMVIDLGAGGGIRAKDLSESDHPSNEPARILRDSLKYRELITLGYNALSRDSLENAEVFLRKAVKLRPHAAGTEIVRFNIAKIEMVQGHLRQAVASLGTVLKIKPDYHEARWFRAVTENELGMSAEVISDCEALLLAEQSDIDRSEILFLRGSARMGLRLYADARADFNEVLRADPQNENAALLCALAYDAEGRTKDALTRINMLLQSNPAFLEALLARAGIETRTEADLAARADYDEAIRLAPQRAQSYVDRAAVLERLGLKHAARKDLEKAVELGMPRTILKKR